MSIELYLRLHLHSLEYMEAPSVKLRILQTMQCLCYIVWTMGLDLLYSGAMQLLTSCKGTCGCHNSCGSAIGKPFSDWTPSTHIFQNTRRLTRCRNYRGLVGTYSHGMHMCVAIPIRGCAVDTLAKRWNMSMQTSIKSLRGEASNRCHCMCAC